MINWFTRNGVAANLLMLLMTFGGVVALFTLKRELFPQFSLDMITIRVPFLGASPEEVEEQVVVRIEEALQGVNGIKEINATATEGFGVVTLTVDKAYDVSKLKDDVKTRIDAIPSFPANTERPIIEDVLIQKDVIRVAVFGKASERDLKRIAERIRNDLVSLPEISQAIAESARDYEISINVSENSLQKYGLTFQQIVNAVRANSLDLPGGAIKAKGGEITLRTKEQAYRGSDFEDLVVLSDSSGAKLRLREVATIDDGFAETDLFSKFNGRPAASILVREVGNENPLLISQAVYRYIDEAKATWVPEGIELEAWSDSSFYLQGRIDMLVENGVIGFFLVLICLAIFLRPSLAFFVAIGIPVSFLATFAVAPLFGITINLLSLFAFILVLGIVVDDAIVVGESVFTEFQKNGPGVESAIRGTHMVSKPVTFAVLTTMVAFVPIFMLPGMMGKFMAVIPLAVIPTLGFSLIQSKLVLPYHLSLCRVGDKSGRAKLNPLSRLQRLFSDGLEHFIKYRYGPLLQKAITWRYYTFAAFSILLAASIALPFTGLVRFVFFPSVPSDYIFVDLSMLEGTPLEQTAAALERIEKALDSIREEDLASEKIDPVKNLSVILGLSMQQGGPSGPIASGSNSNVASVIVELAKSEVRDSNANDVAEKWRQRVGEIPGASRLRFIASAGGPVGLPVNIRLTGRNFDQLKAASLEIQEKLKQVEGLYDIRDTYSQGKRELKLTLHDNARALGLSAADLANQVRNAFYGAEAQRVQRDKEDVKVMVRYPSDERDSLGHLERMRIVAPDGSRVPIAEVADLQFGQGYPTISRLDRQRVINVQADSDKAVISTDEISQKVYGTSISSDPQKREKFAKWNTLLDPKHFEVPIIEEVLSRYPGVKASKDGEAKDVAESAPALLGGFAIVIALIYALLAVPFKSYLQPIIVISVIPFGIAGSIIGHLCRFDFARFSFSPLDVSMLSILGMIAMAGVAVNDSLVLVERINRLREEGTPLALAVQTGSKQRFRAIILTSLTTFVGLIPILNETSLQAQFLIPMATSLAFGVLFATVNTLILVPCFYLMLEDAKWSLQRIAQQLLGWWRGLSRGYRKP